LPAPAPTWTWRDGDRIDLSLDLSLHLWVGERDCEGRASVYRGPLLLAYDPRFGGTEFQALAPLKASGVTPEIAAWQGYPEPWLLLKLRAADGAPVLLCDFATAGATGRPYHTWLRVEGAQAQPFSRQNPLRSAQLKRPAL